MPKKLLLIFGLLLLSFGIYFNLINAVSAQTLLNRSVVVSSAVPSAVTNQTINFQPQTISNVGSVVFEYCESPVYDYVCVAPSGFDASAVALLNQSGNVGFSIDGANSTANKIVLTRPSVPAIATNSSYLFSNITNSNQSNATTYIRISTYATTDGTGSLTDKGAVAYSTVNQFSVGSFVPPFLDLCVAVTVSTNCSSATGDSVNLGILSTKDPHSGTTEFAVGTNSFTGYIVYVLGTSMTSGNNIIPAINPASTSQAGKSQFGINLVANNNPAVGQNPQGPGTGLPSSGYDQSNIFKFSNGDSLASSNIPSDYTKMTVSYISNVSSGQAAGVYNTTLTYLAVAQF